MTPAADYIAMDAKTMARVLCISERTARALIAAEEVPSFKLGSRRLVLREDIEQWAREKSND